MEPNLEYIDVLPPVKIDVGTKKMWVDGHEVKLIKHLTIDPSTSLITLEKYRVYVPDFKFENPWENLFGSDICAPEEATENWDKQKSSVFLDKATRKPLLYTFVIDADNNLYFKSRAVDET